MAERFDVLVIGGGQAGLAAGYFLRRAGRSFAILERSARIGDVWRNRWDSLALFTSAAYSSLPDLPFPGAPNHLPSKDEVADYLEAYATRHDLPVELSTVVTILEQASIQAAVHRLDQRGGSIPGLALNFGELFRNRASRLVYQPELEAPGPDSPHGKAWCSLELHIVALDTGATAIKDDDPESRPPARPAGGA